jgi:hypothetical protein
MDLELLTDKVEHRELYPVALLSIKLDEHSIDISPFVAQFVRQDLLPNLHWLFELVLVYHWTITVSCLNLDGRVIGSSWGIMS